MIALWKRVWRSIRGFFVTRFNEYALLHQHIDVDKLLYTYPRIQYKIVDNSAIVLGIEEAAGVLKEIYDKYDEVTLGEILYTIVEREILLRGRTRVSQCAKSVSSS